MAAGYHQESLELLHKLVPGAKSFAIIACDSETSRPNIKRLQSLANQGKLPLNLVDVVATNSFEEFKARASALAAPNDHILRIESELRTVCAELAREAA